MRSVLTALTFLAACGPSHEPRSEQSWRVITGETAHAEAARAWAEIANAPQAIGAFDGPVTFSDAAGLLVCLFLAGAGISLAIDTFIRKG